MTIYDAVDRVFRDAEAFARGGLSGGELERVLKGIELRKEFLVPSNVGHFYDSDPQAMVQQIYEGYAFHRK